MPDLHDLFYPRNIALIGASPDEVRDRLPFQSTLMAAGYEGDIYPVNPKHTEVMGIKCYPAVKDIPDQVDLGVIMVRAQRVHDALRDCVAAGMKYVVVCTSGFKEIGDEKAQEELLDIIEGSKTRIIGPNCIGVYCSESRVTLPGNRRVGGVGEVGYTSQSGGHALTFNFMGSSRGIRFNKIVSLGNQSDLAHQDFIEYFASDEGIKVICCYLEGLKGGADFFRVVRRVTPQKPVIIWKGGNTEDGMRATASHTAALATPTAIWDSAMRQLGVISVDSIEELADTTLAALYLPLPRGNRTAIVVPGGGNSVELTDGCARNGLSVPPLKSRTQDRIFEVIPFRNTSAANPVDLGAFGRMLDVYGHVVKAVADDPSTDILMLHFVVNNFPRRSPVGDREAYVKALTEILGELKKGCDKPIVCVLPRVVENRAELEGERIDFVARVHKIGIPTFSTVEKASLALHRLWRYREFLKSTRR
jgi:acyl-CoA synthetase (NDP forming)